MLPCGAQLPYDVTHTSSGRTCRRSADGGPFRLFLSDSRSPAALALFAEAFTRSARNASVHRAASAVYGLHKIIHSVVTKQCMVELVSPIKTSDKRPAPHPASSIIRVLPVLAKESFPYHKLLGSRSGLL